jgi:hypothetical protein
MPDLPVNYCHQHRLNTQLHGTIYNRALVVPIQLEPSASIRPNDIRDKVLLVQISLEPISLGSPNQSVLSIQKKMTVLLMMLGEAPKYRKSSDAS